jgi:hypothetical protein
MSKKATTRLALKLLSPVGLLVAAEFILKTKLLK